MNVMPMELMIAIPIPSVIIHMEPITAHATEVSYIIRSMGNSYTLVQVILAKFGSDICNIFVGFHIWA